MEGTPSLRKKLSPAPSSTSRMGSWAPGSTPCIESTSRALTCRPSIFRRSRHRSRRRRSPGLSSTRCPIGAPALTASPADSTGRHGQCSRRTSAPSSSLSGTKIGGASTSSMALT
jgi:hypothetical protein